MGWRVGFLSGWVPLLSDDMQLAESLTHEATTVEEMAHIWSLREGYDKWKLRRILRIGYLALP
jgi:hypothetical protein